MDTLQLQKQKAGNESEIVRMFNAIETTILKDFDITFAGGSVRKAFMREEIGKSDYDIFFKSQSDLNQALYHLSEIGIRVSRHPNCSAITLTPGQKNYGLYVPADGMHIQLITKETHSCTEDLLGRFDFTVCQFAYQKGHFYYTQEAITHSYEKRLSLSPYKEHDNMFPSRFLKYINLGFTPDTKLFSHFFTKDRTSFNHNSCELSDYETLYGGF